MAQFEWLRPLSLQARQAWSERYRQAWPVFVEMLPDLPPSILETGERVGEQTMAIFERFYDHSPRTLIHDDFQLDNFFFASAVGGARFAVIDWQLLARGCGPFDVGPFLVGTSRWKIGGCTRWRFCACITMSW